MLVAITLAIVLPAAIPDYVAAVAKQSAPNGVLVLVQAMPDAEKLPVAVGLRDFLRKELANAGVKLVDSEPAEKMLQGFTGRLDAVKASAIRKSHKYSLLLSGIYQRNKNRRSVALMLLDPVKRRIVWSGKLKIDESQLEELYSAPLKNEAMLAYAKSQDGKQVGNGECWTFVNEALKASGSGWGMEDLFTTTGPVRDGPRLWPGDVVTFSGGVTISDGGSTLRFGGHYAIVSHVYNTNEFDVMHQNFGGKTVKTTRIKLAGMKAGTIKLSRPK